VSWARVGIEEAREYLDLAGAAGPEAHWQANAERQLRGAVAVHNRLVDRRVAWLSDEVGMGKTFVALAVASLVRRQVPAARILYLLPSSRLQPKWRKEMLRFTRSCVRSRDHRVRSFDDKPVRPVLEPRRLRELGAELVIDPDRDVVATLGAFSFALGEEDRWRAAWSRLAELSPLLPARLPRDAYRVDGWPNKGRFKRLYAAALNSLLPVFDLVVCDESHNLRAGARGGAARNQTIAAALGGFAPDVELPWGGPRPGPRVRRLLCLTATPVEHEFAELARQAEVFGMMRPDVVRPEVLRDLELLSQPGRAEQKKDIARRYVVRRVQELHPGGASEGLTKNQYRREWRQGGVAQFDEALGLPSDRERLLVALVQKRVIGALHRSRVRRADGTFLRSFQMGMLSSFESFGESIDRQLTPVFDGDEQTRSEVDRQGVDTADIDQLCSDYRAEFGASPPHPKMDAVARQVAVQALGGDKSLVFVRRIRTTEELAAKVVDHLDAALIGAVRGLLPPSLVPEFAERVRQYEALRRARSAPRPLAEAGDDETDAGGSDSFFAWFFRGAGTDPDRLGARLRRQAFQAPRHPWSIFFHDNHVLWLLGDELRALRPWIERNRDRLDEEARRRFPSATVPGARHFYEAWQAAGLAVLEEVGDARQAALASTLLDDLYPRRKGKWDGDLGDAASELARRPFFARLRNHPLGEVLWPTRPDADTWIELREREERRQLLASTLRLGSPVVALWTTAVRVADSFGVPGGAEGARLFDDLVEQFLDRLSRDAAEQGKHTAYSELEQIATHHRALSGQNFAGIGDVALADLSRYYQAHLSRQSPVVALHGGSKSGQALTQFRMPGYPLVMVATEVVREGVDLHTFCARVLHYGIAWTSSATEQRTGRVDRLGSLTQRRYLPGAPDAMLQVHYPHLWDSVEPLQLAVLYRRMDRFLRMVHDDLGSLDDEGSRIELDVEIGRRIEYPAPPTRKLRSAFGVGEPDLSGGPLAEVDVEPPIAPDDLRRVLSDLASELRDDPRGRPSWHGEVRLSSGSITSDSEEGARRQPFRAALRTRRDGSGFYLRLVSPIGRLDLSDGQVARSLLLWDARTPGVFLSASLTPDGSTPARGTLTDRRVLVEARTDTPLWPGCPAVELVRRALVVVTTEADRFERSFLGAGHDMALSEWV